MEDRGIAEYEFKQNAFDQATQDVYDDIKSMRVVSVESSIRDCGEHDIEYDEDTQKYSPGDWVENIVVNTNVIIEGNGQQYTMNFEGGNSPNEMWYGHSGSIEQYIDERLSKFGGDEFSNQLFKVPDTVSDFFIDVAQTSHNKCVLSPLLEKVDLSGDEILVDQKTSRAQTTTEWAAEILSKNTKEEECVSAINEMDEITSKVRSGEIVINEHGIAEEQTISMSM